MIVVVLKGRNPVLELVCAVKVPGPAQDEREHHYCGSDEYPHDRLVLSLLLKRAEIFPISKTLSINVVSLRQLNAPLHGGH